MKLKKVNNRLIEVDRGWTWDCPLSPWVAEALLKADEERDYFIDEVDGIEFRYTVTEKDSEIIRLYVEEIDKEWNDRTGYFCSYRVKDLRKLLNNSRRPTKESLSTAVNGGNSKDRRRAIRQLKKKLKRIRQRSGYLGGLLKIQGTTKKSLKSYLKENGFRVGADDEVSHPRGRKNTYEKFSQYKNDKLLEEFGLL